MEFLILKRIAMTGLATDWQPVTIAHVEGEEEEEAVKQGYTGDGRYKAIAWPPAEGSEFDLSGPPVVAPVSAAEPAEESE
jgi:hypothetical protein